MQAEVLDASRPIPIFPVSRGYLTHPCWYFICLPIAYSQRISKLHITVILSCLADVGQMCFLDGAFMLGSKPTICIPPTIMSTIRWCVHHCCLCAHRILLPWPAARAKRIFITSPSYISPRCQYPRTSPLKLEIPDSGSSESLKRASVTSPLERTIRQARYSPPPPHYPYICMARSIPTNAKAAAPPSTRQFTIDSKPSPSPPSSTSPSSPLPLAYTQHLPFSLDDRAQDSSLDDEHDGRSAVLLLRG